MWEWSRRKPLGGSHQSTDERLFPAMNCLIRKSGLCLPSPGLLPFGSLDYSRIFSGNFVRPAR
jgi:hypothetical protein